MDLINIDVCTHSSELPPAAIFTHSSFTVSHFDNYFQITVCLMKALTKAEKFQKLFILVGVAHFLQLVKHLFLTFFQIAVSIIILTCNRFFYLFIF